MKQNKELSKLLHKLKNFGICFCIKFGSYGLIFISGVDI